MTLYNLQCRVLSLLREDGPDTGFPLPTTGDFTASTIMRDLNIATAQFISQTGISPALSERHDNYPVFPVLDYPLPPGLISLTRVEYTPAGQQLYKLIGKSLTEFDDVFGTVLPNTTGQPYYYREPFAGYIRLQPQPSIENAVGPGIGTLTISGIPVAGQQITATLVYPGLPSVTTIPYTVLTTDTQGTIANALSNAINQSAAVQGPNPFLQPTSISSNQVSITALVAPGTNITIQGGITGAGATVTPSTATPLSPSGDIISFYYTTLGIIMVNPGDTPNLPPQFHQSLVYRVLADYWLIKENPGQAKAYMDRYIADVRRGMTFTFDMNRATQPTTAGIDEDAGLWPLGSG